MEPEGEREDSESQLSLEPSNSSQSEPVVVLSSPTEHTSSETAIPASGEQTEAGVNANHTSDTLC